MAHVDALATADAIMFLCPKCFQINRGPAGTHSIVLPFKRWAHAGNGYSDLTLTPSIKSSACGLHVTVTNGEVLPA